MARELAPIAGAIGATFLGISPQLGYAFGAIIGNAIDPQRIKGPRLKELPVLGVTEGAHRQVVYGVSVVRDCQLMDWGPLVRDTVETQQGKGGGPVVESERLRQTYAVGIGEPVDGVRYIKRNGKLVYDVRPGSTIIAESAAFASRFRFYDGSESQLPDPDLEALSTNGVGNTPYYRGTSYLVFPLDDLTDLQGRIPTYEVECVKSGTAVPADEVAMEEFGDLNADGGITSNWLRVNIEEYDAEAFMAFTTTWNPAPASGGPIKARAYCDGRIVYDSGWLGLVADQADLTEFMTECDMIRIAQTGEPNIDITDPSEITAYLIELNDGLITGAGPNTGFYATPAPGGKVQLYFYRPDSENHVSVGGSIKVYRPDPLDVPEAYVALPELPGVLVGLSTGTTYFTPYATGIDGIDPDAITISEIVEDIADRCGIASAQLDLAELTDEVDGITLGGDYDGAGSITTLMPAFFFDLFEADKQIHAPKRGAAVVQTITADDFIEGPDENILRGQGIEYPRELQLKYLNPGQDYAAPAAVVARSSPDIRVRGLASADLPISMDETAALRVADRILKVLREDLNGDVTFALPAGPFAWLTPTDCLGLSLRGGLYRIRVEKVVREGRVLQVTAKRDRQSAYTSNLTEITLPTPTAPPASLVGPTLWALLNIPAIADDDDRTGYRHIGTAILPGWSGFALQRRLESQATYTEIDRSTARGVMGYLQSAVTAASEFGTDTTNVIRVQLADSTQEIEALTDLEFLQEGGGWAIDNGNGTWELGQYRDVTDEGGGVFALSYLARGRGNTGATAHASGALFVLLADTRFVEAPLSSLDTVLTHRPVGLGTSPEVADIYTDTFDPNYSQLEMPVSQLAAIRDSSNVITATWSERRRLGTAANPIRSANWQGYRITVIKGATEIVLPDQTTEGVSYDATALGSGVTIRVQQINRITGLGPEQEVTA